MAIFTKAILGSAVAGTIVLGTMVTYDGGSTIDLAKTKITEQAQQIGVFKTNETALVTKVNNLKTERAILKLEVDNLKIELAAEEAKNTTDNVRILELESQIAAKNTEISDLETEIGTLSTELENTAGNTAAITERIGELEDELNAANAKAIELKTTLDNTTTVVSDQVAVDEALSGTEPVIVDGGADDGTSGEITANEIAMIGSTPIALMSGVKLTKVESGGVWTMTLESSSGDDHTITIDGESHTLAAGGFSNLGTNIELDGSTLTITNTFNNNTATFTLANK